MTGKTYSDKRQNITYHDIKYVLSKSGWVFIVGLAAFLVLIPFLTAGLPGDSIYNIEVTHDQLKFRLINENAVPAVFAAAVILGLVSGISLFRFVQEKKDTTIFFSMGLTRNRLFMNRMTVGMVMLAFMIMIPLLISVILNINALGGYQYLIRNAVYLWAGIFLTAAASYVLAVIMCFIAGTMMELMIFWTGIISIPTAMCWGCNLLMKKLYWGNAIGVTAYSGEEQIQQSLLERFAFLNPLLFFKDAAGLHAQFMRPLKTEMPEPVSWELIIGWTAGVAVLTILAWYLLKIWKAENAGIAGTSRLFAIVIPAETAFVAFTIVFAYMFEFSAGLALAAGAAAFLVMQLFWRKAGITLQMQRRSVLISIGGQALALVLICIIFSTGFMGSTDRFFDKQGILKAEVTYAGNPSMLCEEASGSSTGRGYYIVSSLQLQDSESIEKVKELHRMFASAGRCKMASSENIEDTMIPYDITFSYIDSGGKTHIWYYDRASYGQLEKMLALEDMDEVRQAQQMLFDNDVQSEQVIWADQAYTSGTIYMTDSFLSQTYELSLGAAERALLLKALENDLQQMSIEDRYFPKDNTEAVLMFSQTGEDDSQYFTYHLDNTFIYVTKEYSNTLKWLEDNELLDNIKVQPEIESVILQRMDPYIGINAPDYPIGMYFMSYCADTADEFLIQKDFGNAYTIADKDKISEITPCLKNGYYMSRGGYLAAVKLAGMEKYRYMFLPEAEIPSFIRN